MRGRTLLFLSLGLNVVLVAGLLFYWRADKVAVSAANTMASGATNVVSHDRVIPVYRRQFFTWNELESTNYDTYIANLRDIDCPEETIHDIILADVNKLYDQRKANEDQTPQHFKLLDDERHSLLAHLLGSAWDKTEQQTGFTFSRVAFTDPLLDQLSADVRTKVQDILSRWSQAATTDPQKNAELEQRMRFELAGVLSPPQMEELLSRYSANANHLRQQLDALKYFQPSPDEFHQLFRATDNIDMQLRLLGDATDAATQQQRASLMQQREFNIRTALGPKRYGDYVQLQDPSYRDAVAQAAANRAPASVGTLREINQQAAIESAVTQVDPSLTETQKALELKQIELDQMKAQAQAVGQIPPMPPGLGTASPRYVRPYMAIVGDTADAIAQRYGVSVGDLQAANPGINLNSIRGGQPILVPTPTAQQ